VDFWLREVFPEGGDLVGLHPGAGVALKTWPAARWVAVGRGLPESIKMVVTAGPGERDLAEVIADGLGDGAVVAPELDWDELAALYASVCLVMGMDSGPLHLATAVATPTVRIYGPTDPMVYGPNGELPLHRAIQATLPCIPCGDLIAPPCGYLIDPPCLAAVPIERVTRIVAETLVRGAPADAMPG